MHLDDLFEGGGISLDVGSWVQVVWFGFGDGHGSSRWWDGWPMELAMVMKFIAAGAAA